MAKQDDARLALVNAGHHFLWNVLPLRHPGSREAVAVLVDHARRSTLPEADIDAVLLRCLVVLDRYSRGRLPSLVARYSAGATCPAHSVDRFASAVDSLLGCPSVGHALVEQAIAEIQKRLADSSLRQSTVANALGVSSPLLSTVFKATTGVSFRRYLSHARLDKAAELLATGCERIKDVWVQVGYNHASNFDHDFKRRFGVTPLQYRGHSRQLTSREHVVDLPVAPSMRAPADQEVATVLVVDDDLDTRLTVARIVQVLGYRAGVAPSGEAALLAAVEDQPAAVLLDYRLPDMDGLACLRELRRLNLARQPGVAIFTADWSVYDNADEIRTLNARIVSKLCDFNDLESLTAALVREAGTGSTPTPSKAWTNFVVSPVK